MKDYYKILGIDKNATKDEIKKKYDDLVIEFHPDVNKSPDASDKFAEIQEAYNTLVDDSKKQQYDNMLNFGMNNDYNSNSNYNNSDNYNDFSNFFQKDSQENNSQYFYYSNTQNSNLDNFFKNFFNFGGNSRKQYNSNNQQSDLFDLFGKRNDLGDISFNVLLTFKEACLGINNKKITYFYTNDKGEKKKRVLNLNIESGTTNNQIIAFRNGGNFSNISHQYGKVFIQFIVKNDPLLSLDENGNVRLVVHINMFKAFFGCTVKIPTLFGIYNLNIPPKTKHNDKIIINRYGVPKYDESKQINIIKIDYELNLKSSNYNNLLSIFKKISFNELSDREKKFLNELKKYKYNKDK